MLQDNITNFLQYCKDSNLSERSIESLAFRLHEFNQFIQSQAISALQQINYQLLTPFVADYHKPSVAVKKARVWCLRQFFHYLKLQSLINDNIALQLPYPKIEQKVPQFLTVDEFKLILNHFAQQATTANGLRNLVIIALLGFLGLRISTLADLNITDIDLAESCIWIKQKGVKQPHKKSLPLPQVLCQLLAEYIQSLHSNQGPLFLSKRNQPLARRSLPSRFYQVTRKLNIDKSLHPHLFRHTAAPQLNQIAGLEITQFV